MTFYILLLSYLFLFTNDFLYSLRTSEANYLHESFGFYSAIRSRAYYSQASKEDKYASSVVSDTVIKLKRRMGKGVQEASSENRTSSFF